MYGQNPPPRHISLDDDEIEIIDIIPPKSGVNSPRTSRILSLINSTKATLATSHATLNQYPRVHYNVAKNSIAHGDVFDPLDFPDTSSEKSIEEECGPLNPFSATRIFTVKNLKYNQDQKSSPYLPLSFEEARKEKLLKLSPVDCVKVEAREKELQKFFEDDCVTHGYFAQCFINKNKSLEASLRNALNETLKDLETKYMKELEIYINLFIAKSTD
uniref:Uncharacterized protein n=1 Tax=Panagrolaimus sp. PS1159 TaxID=55785 RepID=A0AC35FJ07_9BILA